MKNIYPNHDNCTYIPPVKKSFYWANKVCNTIDFYDMLTDCPPTIWHIDIKHIPFIPLYISNQILHIKNVKPTNIFSFAFKYYYKDGGITKDGYFGCGDLIYKITLKTDMRFYSYLTIENSHIKQDNIVSPAYPDISNLPTIIRQFLIGTCYEF